MKLQLQWIWSDMRMLCSSDNKCIVQCAEHGYNNVLYLSAHVWTVLHFQKDHFWPMERTNERANNRININRSIFLLNQRGGEQLGKQILFYCQAKKHNIRFKFGHVLLMLPPPLLLLFVCLCFLIYLFFDEFDGKQQERSGNNGE